MEGLVLETINRIYHNKDYDFFKRKCEAELIITDDLVRLIEHEGFKVMVQDVEVGSSIRFAIDYPEFEKGEMKVSYITMIDVSKIIPIFYVQHEFEVENIDENRMGPVLDGFGGQSYTIGQADIYDKIVTFLEKQGYSEVSYAEMDIAIPDIKMPEDAWLFGPQFTVRTCLFHDILDICERYD